MELKINYQGEYFNIEGEIVPKDEEVGIFSESFDITEVKHNNIIIEPIEYFSDIEYDEIIDLCVIAGKEQDQSKWEEANV